MIKKFIEKKIDKYPYVSFDVFDTLLERKCLIPQKLFFNVGDKVLNRGKAFLKIRQEAEEKAYQQYGSGANLDNIYKNILQYDDSVIDELKKEEIKQELENSQARGNIQDIYNYAISKNKGIYIISDMYLPEEIILKMLNINGESGFTRVYVANVYAVDKRSGKLFKKVMEDQGFSENEIIHVGDSVKADILGSKKAGINSIFIPRRKMLKRYLKKV